MLASADDWKECWRLLLDAMGFISGEAIVIEVGRTPGRKRAVAPKPIGEP